MSQKKPVRQTRPQSVDSYGSIDENTPLTVAEQKFLTNYINTSNLAEAVALTPELHPEGRSRNACTQLGSDILKRPNIKKEYLRIVAEARTESVAAATEVMAYFTRVMRGEEKDQFGLDAPLSERTRAAQELAKRTIDIENRMTGVSDQKIEIKLDWSR